MRIEEFKHLATTFGKPPEPQAHSPESGVFVPYVGLRSRGIFYSRVHLRRLIARGLFPAPVQVSANRIAWRADDLANWAASRPNAPIAAEHVT